MIATDGYVAESGGIGIGAVGFVDLQGVTIAAGIEGAATRWAIFFDVNGVTIATDHTRVAIIVVTISGVAHARARSGLAGGERQAHQACQ